MNLAANGSPKSPALLHPALGIKRFGLWARHSWTRSWLVFFGHFGPELGGLDQGFGRGTFSLASLILFFQDFSHPLSGGLKGNNPHCLTLRTPSHCENNGPSFLHRRRRRTETRSSSSCKCSGSGGHARTDPRRQVRGQGGGWGLFCPRFFLWLGGAEAGSFSCVAPFPVLSLGVRSCSRVQLRGLFEAQAV